MNRNMNNDTDLNISTSIDTNSNISKILTSPKYCKTSSYEIAIWINELNTPMWNSAVMFIIAIINIEEVQAPIFDVLNRFDN